VVSHVFTLFCNVPAALAELAWKIATLVLAISLFFLPTLIPFRPSGAYSFKDFQLAPLIFYIPADLIILSLNTFIGVP
jgi:hypothetical protein